MCFTYFAKHSLHSWLHFFVLFSMCEVQILTPFSRDNLLSQVAPPYYWPFEVDYTVSFDKWKFRKSYFNRAHRERPMHSVSCLRSDG